MKKSEAVVAALLYYDDKGKLLPINFPRERARAVCNAKTINHTAREPRCCYYCCRWLLLSAANHYIKPNYSRARIVYFSTGV